MNPLLETLRNLGPLRLAALGATALALIAFFFFIGARLTSPGMSLLYGGLDSTDSAAIAARLQEQQVPFEVKGDGSQIYVAADRVGQLRLVMAGEGLPNGGTVGYEIFDRPGALGTTNFVQQINQMRALEGELARTVRALRQVKGARVHLVMPKRELFSRDRAEPSASVVVTLQGTLEKEQIAAIQHLVASSVPGMKTSAVSIIDDKGRLLARGGAEGELTQLNAEEMRRSYELRLTQSIEELLSRTLGPGKVRAEVTAELDFNQVTTNTETYDPEGQVVRSTQTVEENEQSQEREPQNNVTVANNVPNPPGAAAGAETSASSTLQRTEETVNFEISKTSQTEVKHSGDVRKISAAILVDGTYTADANGNQAYAPLPQEELDKIATLVRSAIGYNAERGDVVEVINMQFVAPELPEEVSLLGLDKTDLMRIAELVVLSLVAILVLLLVVRPLLNRVLAIPGAAPEQFALAGPGGAALPPGAAAALALPGTGGADLAALPGADGGTLGDITNIANEIEQMIDINQVEGRVRASSLKRISELVDQHPEQAVNIMRQWIYQEA
ncbi:flagellar M-ring protein FliF [Dongia mobilis]|uniref:Flagellar M-ring protein n=1 Tax=Dongia mobilis TaxID=578943 RepID=A0A4R6WRX0_9PROT|nr:flagellar basal-body MS-ring/collar protein FliF [Dongia mobilis]TDQ84355.1 flagellar M-ring protein FliF [Dongia mobilis]